MTSRHGPRIVWGHRSRAYYRTRRRLLKKLGSRTMTPEDLQRWKEMHPEEKP